MCVYKCVYKCIQVCTCVYMCVHKCVYLCVYKCACMCVCVCTHACTSVCACVCVHRHAWQKIIPLGIRLGECYRCIHTCTPVQTHIHTEGHTCVTHTNVHLDAHTYMRRCDMGHGYAGIRTRTWSDAMFSVIACDRPNPPHCILPNTVHGKL